MLGWRALNCITTWVHCWPAKSNPLEPQRAASWGGELMSSAMSLSALSGPSLFSIYKYPSFVSNFICSLRIDSFCCIRLYKWFLLLHGRHDHWSVANAAPLWLLTWSYHALGHIRRRKFGTWRYCCWIALGRWSTGWPAVLFLEIFNFTFLFLFLHPGSMLKDVLHWLSLSKRSGARTEADWRLLPSISAEGFTSPPQRPPFKI